MDIIRILPDLPLRIVLKHHRRIREKTTEKYKQEFVNQGWTGDIERVKTLLELGVDINCSIQKGATIMTQSAYHGHLNLVKY